MKTLTEPAMQVIQLAVSTWASRNTAFTSFFNKYDEEIYFSEIASGRNRAIYLLGHLIAVNDGMLPLFGLGNKLFPELEPFAANPDRSFDISQSLAELKAKWEQLNTFLAGSFENMSVTDWLGKHTAVSDADFEKEPHRNKLNVLLGRTNHLSYHLGQLNLLKVEVPVD